jgi:sugar phosphate isomerase/epimerase
MALAITSDYVKDTGCPEPYLRQIAEAGFSHVHWCHHWNDDFVYSMHEVEQIARWLAEFGLHLLDLHASQGQEKHWLSTREYERLAGVELVKNRIEMTARLASDVIIMHVPAAPQAAQERDPFWTRLHRSLDDLAPFAAAHGVRIAVENMGGDEGHWTLIQELFAEYGPQYLGLCYDSGHGNIGKAGLDHLEALKDRLISVHLHDNDGHSDQHRLPFSGTVDWGRLTRIIAESAYAKCLSLEVSMRHSGIGVGEKAFLAKAFEAGTTLTEMVGNSLSRAGR